MGKWRQLILSSIEIKSYIGMISSLKVFDNYYFIKGILHTVNYLGLD
jgi:hypothetical protein